MNLVLLYWMSLFLGATPFVLPSRARTSPPSYRRFQTLHGTGCTAGHSTAVNSTPETRESPRIKTSRVAVTAALVAITLLIPVDLSTLRRSAGATAAGANACLLSALSAADRAGPRGLMAYVVAFTVWEMTAGITTPVETAAGMAFGRTRGAAASGTGKLLGASASFLLGRYLLKDLVRKRLGENDILSLVRDSIRDMPLRVALLVRFSSQA